MARRSTPNVSKAAGEFTEQRYRRGRSESVRYGYVSLLRRFAASVGDLQVGSLTPGHVEDFFYGRGGLHETCGHTTLGKYRGDLKTFLDFCHRRGWSRFTGEQMVAGIADKSTKANRDRTRLDPFELTRLMDAATEPRDRCLIAFVANTGVRISEALEVRVRDINLKRGEMYLRLLKLNSKEETYYITTDLDTELRRWIKHYQDKNGPLKPEWRLFPARMRGGFAPGGGHRRVKAVPEEYNATGKISNPAETLHRIATEAGVELEKGDGWHTIRRSIARIFFDSASDLGHDAALRLTQSLLKHKNSQTTEGYIGLDLEKRKVQEILQGKPFLSRLTAADNVIPIARETKDK